MAVSEKEELLSLSHVSEYINFLEAPEGYLYASSNKFHRLFGRDSIITCLELLPWTEEYSKNTIIALKNLQNKNGQIIHETIKENTMWDSIDSTPLFLILISEYYQKTDDTKLIKELMTNIEKALRWIEKEADKDGDIFIEYYENKNGLNNHCWKDSHEGMSREDGSFPKYPIAPVETQGYLYKAFLGIAEIYLKFQIDVRSKELFLKARELKYRFNNSFWMEDEGFYALGLDGDKNQIKTVSSNIGHALWSGIIEDEKIPAVVERMLKEDMFTKYGLRTLSSKMGNYNPHSYHNGNIWPFDNWFFAEGLDKYGYNEKSNEVRKAVLDALNILESSYECYSYADGRLGLKLRNFEGGDLYPEKIQAWTLGAMYSFLKKLNKAD